MCFSSIFICNRIFYFCIRFLDFLHFFFIFASASFLHLTIWATVVVVRKNKCNKNTACISTIAPLTRPVTTINQSIVRYRIGKCSFVGLASLLLACVFCVQVGEGGDITSRTAQQGEPLQCGSAGSGSAGFIQTGRPLSGVRYQGGAVRCTAKEMRLFARAEKRTFPETLPSVRFIDRVGFQWRTFLVNRVRVKVLCFSFLGWIHFILSSVSPLNIHDQ